MKERIPALLLAILMATMSFTTVTSAEDSGRQAMDVDCSGYTFEDLFEYNNAVFMFEILDDWATSDLYANSWVNESRASVVRDNLDSLFEGLPGGNDNWISTDERDAVREIGAKCIADMYTRIGIREGLPHRGDVDWNDVTFVEEGIGLEEVNLVPEGHPDERVCPASSGRIPSDDCKEVPTTATNNLEISMFTKEDETHNTRFNQLPNFGNGDYENQTFTVAMNATNVTSATMVFSFPYVDGLRMANWTIEDDGETNLEAGSIIETHLPDGSVRVTLTIGYDKADYPMIRNIFFDMTTTPPEENDIPVWSSYAPEDNTIIPIIKDGSEVVAITGNTMENWASDDNAWGLDCEFAETGWSSRMNSDGELLVTSGSSESGTAECSIVDPYGATNNETHTWRFGQPASFSAVAGSYSDSVDIDANPTLLVQSLAVGMAAYQNGGDGPVTNFNLGTTSSSNSVSLSGMSPGEFMIHVTASSDGMLDWNTMLDLSLEKKNTPPVITVKTDEIDGTQATWASDQYSFSLSGTAIDPDGGVVTLSANMCGETTTAFTRDGENWDVSLSIAKCVSDGVTQYDVIITATDPVNGIATADVSVPDPFAGSNTDTGDTDTLAEESGLPSIGMFATIISMLGAALLLRRD
jgi:hypothetical protein